MSESETILLVMADPARRAACFAQLADRPQRIVRGFADPAAAAEALDDGISGCLVLDHGGLAAATALSLLRTAADFPAITPLLLTDRLSPAEVLALIRTGPGDILPAATPPDQLAAHIAAIMPAALARAARWRAMRSAAQALARLSPREGEVLAALAQGQTSKDIARTLAVSPRTVEVHRASIMRRTGTGSLAELLRLSFLAELADPIIGSKAA